MNPSHVLTRFGLVGVMATLTALAPTGDQTLLVASETSAKDDGQIRRPSFLRLERDAAGKPTRLQTAIVRYVSPASVRPQRSVDLVAAIHIADSAYYDQLNSVFQAYDSVLYELVAPPEQSVPQPGESGRHPIGIVQRSMTRMLDLSFQLDGIDYTRPNFIHADLTPEQMKQRMKDRGESPASWVLRIAARQLLTPHKTPPEVRNAQLLAALWSPNRSHRLKEVMAEELHESLDGKAFLDGQRGTTLINERNKRAMEVLGEQMEAGNRTLAIFYGAAHLPHFHRILTQKWNYRIDSTRWLTAWDLQSED